MALDGGGKGTEEVGERVQGVEGEEVVWDSVLVGDGGASGINCGQEVCLQCTGEPKRHHQRTAS